MKVVQRPIDDIKPYEKNPRQNDDAVDAVAQSIREFGFRQPIVVDADGVIICGHALEGGAQTRARESTGACRRHAFLMEIDPAYCDVIVQRWEEFTGRKAERLASDAVPAASETIVS